MAMWNLKQVTLMTAIIKLKDNVFTKKNEFESINHLTKKILDKTLKQLEKEGVFVFPEEVSEAEDITKDQMILQRINDCYRTSNVLGFLGYGKERLVIESRFSTGKSDYFFQYLLECVLDFPNFLELHTDADQNSRMFNLLVFLFPYYLKSAMRKGLFKTYKNYQYNDGNLKGTIDIARHIIRNTPFTGNISYNQREFSFDNDLMQLIRHTIEFIKTKPYGNKLLRRAKDEISAIYEATTDYEYYDRRKIIIANRKKPIRHAFYHDYRELQRLCIMILQYEKQQIGSGVRQLHGILFDGAWLWEEYINSLIGQFFYHPRNKGKEGAQRLFAGNVGLIYPDFISRDNKNRTIADAKYKPINNIGNKDYLQVLAYMFRFDATNGYYFYPESGEIKNLELHLNSGSTYEKDVGARENIRLSKYGLLIPNNVADYDQFKTQMKESELSFKSHFDGL